MIAIDLLAPIALTQAVLPRMVRAGGGHIVAISSVAGIVGAPLRSAYSAAKHGLIGYHDSVRAENEHLGIQVHVVRARIGADERVEERARRRRLGARRERRGDRATACRRRTPRRRCSPRSPRARASSSSRPASSTRSSMLRRRDPEALFDQMSALVRAGYAQSMSADTGKR